LYSYFAPSLANLVVRPHLYTILKKANVSNAYAGYKRTYVM